MFDINKLKNVEKKNDRFQRRIEELTKKGYDTQYIEDTVNKSINNLKEGKKSFVIYGDPQSGKTEMMIALTTKLLDLEHKIIVVLLNDNVGLLEQNLSRFSKAGLDPSPRNFKDILDEQVKLELQEWIIFCKKNSSDLTKLINKLKKVDDVVIIDDEADYASPNSKINKINKKTGESEKTKINSLIHNLLKNGIYIGVTATPARLDLNNTFDNDNTRWISFESHPNYTGQDIFFPLDMTGPKFKLNLLQDDYPDNPKYLRTATFGFLVNVAYLNCIRDKDKGENNYSFLIHTSGKKNDHLKDSEEIQKIMNVIKNKKDSKFERYIKEMWTIAKTAFGEQQAYTIINYVLSNKNKITIHVINSEKDKEHLDRATNPISLFTIAIGGNIVSRGVTFNNLLSMYFTRNVKTKLQQDTYIQRARMFGTRKEYLEHFELTIPKELYIDWQKCFAFHKLALDSIKSGNVPVWIEDNRTKVAASTSIIKTIVEISRGEMSFRIFDYSEEIEKIIKDEENHLKLLDRLHHEFGEECLPTHLVNFIKHFSPNGQDSVAIHFSSDISQRGEDTDKILIMRPKGFIGATEMEKNKYPHAVHHLKIFYNKSKKIENARVFYRFSGSVSFLKNERTRV